MNVWIAIGLFFLIASFIRVISMSIDGCSLQKKFISLGNMSGKTLDEITQVVGPPNSVSTITEGKVLYQWVTTNYHIALLFNEGLCEKITSEYIKR